MRHTGGNLSHRRHRTGPWGQVTRKHRTEVARLLGEKPKRPGQRMYEIRDLMRGRS